MSGKKRALSDIAARRLLVVCWSAGFLASMAMVFSLYVRGWIGEDNFQASLTRLSALYAPYLGGIFGYYLSNRAKPASARDAGTAFVLAITGSAAWNLVMAGLLSRVLFFDGTIEQTLKDLMFFGSVMSWLVAPAIAFYFTSPSPQEGEASHES